MSHLALRNVQKRFGRYSVLHGIDLEIADGEFVVFVGPSGCGKSTLMRVIAGLETASDGDIHLDGRRVNDLPAADRGLAMVFQSYALYPHMSVRQNLAFGLENSRMPRAEIDARVTEAAAMLMIGPLLDRKPRQLSGGQRQRVAIGRAIVRRPGIFLLDEPLSNLDAELRVVMRAELAALHQRLGATMIYVTHDQTEAMTLADRIVVLKDGRIEQVGTPLELYNHPANRFVAGFIGSPRMNFIEARVTARNGRGLTVALDGQGTGPGASIPLNGPLASAPLSVGETLTLGIRPQDATLADPAAAALPLDVTLVEQLGAETIVHARTPAGGVFTVATAGQRSLAVGDRIGAALLPDRLHAFNAAGRALGR